MEAYFRSISNHDISYIKKFIGEIWDGQDYVIKFIEQWLVEGDTIQIGVFPSSQMCSHEILGYGQLRPFPNGVGWLEAGRISPRVQQQGLGTQLAEYMLNYAISKGFKVLQYNAWATRDFMGDNSKDQTHGSIGIARRLGFRVKDYMDVLSAKGSNLQLNSNPDPSKRTENLTKISPSDAFNKLSQILKPPPSEICHGWGYYLPNIPEIINNVGDHVTWIVYGKVIAQFIHYDPDLAQESPIENELWIILYGNSLDASELLKLHLRTYADIKSFENISVFCHPQLSNLIIPYGFQYYSEMIPSGAVLFEKVLD
ncbi:MAG: GNAT family N-acetyltransferase [Promethearchaeota archaeon]